MTQDDPVFRRRYGREKGALVYRRIIIFMNTLTFLFAQFFSTGAFALQASELAAYNEFFAQSGVTKKAVPLKEIYQKFGNNLPADIRLQMEHYLKENPKVMLPKVDVQKIGQEMQISYSEGTDHLVVRTKSGSGSVWGTVVGTRNGVEVKEDISVFALIEGAQYVYQQRVAEEMRKPKFLNAADFQKLDQSQRVQYLQKIRLLLENVESLQNARGLAKEEASIFDFMIEKAWALEGTCIIAGYVGDYYSSNKCKLPRGPTYSQGSCKAGSTQCNPLLYGPNSCVENKDIRDATKTCNGKNNAVDAILVHMNKIKDEASFNELMTGIKKQVSQYSDDCEKTILPNYNARKIGKDQKDTCEALVKRVQEINALACTDFESRLGKTSSFKCKPQPTPAPVAQAPGASDAKPSAVLSQCPEPTSAAGADGGGGAVPPGQSVGAGTTGGTSQAACVPVTQGSGQSGTTGVDGAKASEAASAVKPATSAAGADGGKPQARPQSKTDEERQKQDCAELRKVQGGLKCGANSSIEKLSCDFTTDGKTVKEQLNYCVCKNPEEAKGNGKISPQYSIECSKSEPTKTSSSSSSKKSESSEFMKGLVKVLPFAVGGLTLILGYLGMKKQAQSTYDMYLKQMNSIQAPVPPPTTSTTAPITLTPPAAGGSR